MRRNFYRDDYGNRIYAGDIVSAICDGQILRGEAQYLDDDDTWIIADRRNGFAPCLWTCDNVKLVRRADQ